MKNLLKLKKAVVFVLLCVSSLSLFCSCKPSNDNNDNEPNKPTIQENGVYEYSCNIEHVSDFDVSFYTDIVINTESRVSEENKRTQEDLVSSMGSGLSYVRVSFNIDENAIAENKLKYCLKLMSNRALGGANIIYANTSSTSQKELTASFSTDDKVKNCLIIFAMATDILDEIEFAMSVDEGNFATCYYSAVPKANYKLKAVENGYFIKECISIDSSYGSILVPSWYNGHPIIGIDNKAFFEMKNLKGVKIGNNIEYIGMRAFYKCRNLENVMLGSGISFIDIDAFDGCSYFEIVSFGGTIDSWAEICFAKATSNPVLYSNRLIIDGQVVTEVNITTATKVGKYAFMGCYFITQVNLSSSVSFIEKSAFDTCSDLVSVTLPNNISIDSQAFYNCSNLQDLYYDGTQAQWNKVWKGEYWNSFVSSEFTVHFTSAN